MKKKLVVLSGAGISAESGISTFRDQNGLWENHDIMEVASIDGWNKNPVLVLDFYNKRRAQLAEKEPNIAHLTLADLEREFNVHIITQNVDDLHERAQSSNIIHLHGELRKACPENNKSKIEDIGFDKIEIGDKINGVQKRPFIVWFGEDVPMMEQAINTVMTADILLIIGTSMNVYPAASLNDYAPDECKKYLIDPNKIGVPNSAIHQINETATKGILIFKDLVINH
jgi:NAD-dependent deacetylase